MRVDSAGAGGATALNPADVSIRPERAGRSRSAAAVTSHFVMGGASTLAVLLPLLGQTFSSYAGVHPRVVGLALAGLSIAAAFRSRTTVSYPTWSRWLFRLSLALLLLSVFVSFDWSGRVLAFNNRFLDADYPAYKLTRVLVVLLPISAMAVAVGPFAAGRDFQRGLGAASLLVGILALVQFAMHADRFVVGVSGDEMGFSVISLSLLILNLQSLAQDWFTRHVALRRGVIYVGVMIACLACHFFLSQRTAIAMNALLWALLLYRMAPGAISGGLLGVMGVYGAVSALHSLMFGAGGLTKLLAEFAWPFLRTQRMFDLDDVSYGIRVEMVGYAMRHGPDHVFTGHGLGSFLSHFGAHYPHNIIAEAFFEQGLAGLLTTSALLGVSGWVCLQLLVTKRSDVVLMGIVVSWVYALKANSMTEFGMVLFWIAVGLGVVARTKDRGRRSNGPPNERSGVLDSGV